MINRQNYEEWFLLYADNELSARQRTEVELFAQQNADMAAELDAIMQVKLQPEEDIFFPGKQNLYKTTDVEININNYEEFFFLYIDRELDEAGMQKVEKFVLQHPQLQDEFTLLKQTVLQPETIVFAGKEGLYRKEESKRVVPFFTFARMAVAAAVIAIAITGWWLYPTTKGTHPAGQQVAVNKIAPTQAAKPVTTPQTAPVAPAPQVLQQDKNSVATVKPIVKPKAAPVQQLQQQKVNNEVPAQVANNVDNNAVANNTVKPSDNSVQQVSPQNATNAGGINNQAVASVDPPKATSHPVIDSDADRVKEMKQGGTPDKETVASATVPFKVIDTDDENKSMYVGSLELNKDKVKGFLKRAGRIFGSRNKKDTD